MVEKTYYLDRKFTVWERQHLVVERETQEEIDEYVENVDLSSINFHLGEDDQFDEVNVETLYDTMEYLPLAENGYQPVLELIDENMNTIKDNLNDIEPEDVKMFSINDIKSIWFNCYNENLDSDYMGIYNKLIEIVKS
mgnify:CR=1 FL=1